MWIVIEQPMSCCLEHHHLHCQIKMIQSTNFLIPIGLCKALRVTLYRIGHSLSFALSHHPLDHLSQVLLLGKYLQQPLGISPFSWHRKI